jgi:hypothetical protein
MANISDYLSPINVTLDQLLLDPNNPRFAEQGQINESVPETRIAEDRIQRDALERMKAIRFDVAELRDTIKAVGYLPVDRIVVRSWGRINGKESLSNKFVVIEGNRRIAALKWLIQLHETGRETLTDDQIRNFTHIPALILDEERAPESVRLVIPGLRHVSGIKEWGAYQKARAVYTLRQSGEHPRIVAQSLGLSTQAANQLWRSYLALEQMRNDEEFGEFVEPNMYSYFEEIMKKPNVRSWLGWNDTEERFTDDIHTKELYGWMIGEPLDDDDIQNRSEPKLREAKSIRELSRFIDDESSLNIFRLPDGSLTRALSHFESEHQEAWQRYILTASSTLSALTPDILRAFQSSDIEILQNLLDRIKLVLSDREKLLHRTAIKSK